MDTKQILKPFMDKLQAVYTDTSEKLIKVLFGPNATTNISTETWRTLLEAVFAGLKDSFFLGMDAQSATFDEHLSDKEQELAMGLVKRKSWVFIEWTDTRSKLPPDGEEVLFTDNVDYTAIGYCSKDSDGTVHWYGRGELEYTDRPVTHWMPKPPTYAQMDRGFRNTPKTPTEGLYTP